MSDIRSTRWHPVAGVPGEFLNDVGVAWDKIQEFLAVRDREDLAKLLLYFYQVDDEFNRAANVKILALAIGLNAGQNLLPAVPSPAPEAAWVHADNYCVNCPGSELHELIPGLFLPRCLNGNRASRYKECLKYRENLAEATPTPEEEAAAYKALKEKLEGLK